MSFCIRLYASLSRRFHLFAKDVSLRGQYATFGFSVRNGDCSFLAFFFATSVAKDKRICVAHCAVRRNYISLGGCILGRPICRKEEDSKDLTLRARIPNEGAPIFEQEHKKLQYDQYVKK